MIFLKHSFFLVAILFVVAYSTNKIHLKIPDLSGKLILFKDVRNEKTIDHSGVPSASKIAFQDNAYLPMLDKITQERTSNFGVGTIQDNLKGQFEIPDNVIQMNHYTGNSLIKKELEVVSFNEETLVLKYEKTYKTSYIKK